MDIGTPILSSGIRQAVAALVAELVADSSSILMAQLASQSRPDPTLPKLALRRSFSSWILPHLVSSERICSQDVLSGDLSARSWPIH